MEEKEVALQNISLLSGKKEEFTFLKKKWGRKSFLRIGRWEGKIKM